MSLEMLTPYAGHAEILLLMKRKLNIGRVKSLRLSSSFVLIFDFNVEIKVRSRLLSISSILNFKFIRMDTSYVIK
jgi:hypothetical protein